MKLFKNKKTVQSINLYVTGIVLTDVKLKERRKDIFQKTLLEQLKEIINHLYIENGALRKAFDNACAETKQHLGRLGDIEKERDSYKQQLAEANNEVNRLNSVIDTYAESGEMVVEPATKAKPQPAKKRR